MSDTDSNDDDVRVFQIRPDVSIPIPVDITPKEAERLKTFVDSLIIDG